MQAALQGLFANAPTTLEKERHSDANERCRVKEPIQEEKEHANVVVLGHRLIGLQETALVHQPNNNHLLFYRN